MYRVSMTLVCAAAALLFVAQPVLATTDVDAELAEMRELVDGLKQKVDAQEEQLSHQSELLEDAQKVVQQTQQDTKALSGLAAFVESLEVEGGISASYFWNFNTPESDGSYSSPFGGPGINGDDGVGNRGMAQLLHPFHPDHNTINMDQIYFGFGKPASAESRAGFKFDIMFGNSAQALVWYRRAAEAGYPPSQAVLGGMYSTGEAVEVDHAEARKWLRQAAAQGEPAARDYLLEHYPIEGE